jgi:trehalose 6-phosphate synthase/phosphatase
MSLIISHDIAYLLWICVLTFARRLVIHIQGFNGTLTEPVEKTGDQIKEMELKVHPELRQPLTALCSDPNTTVVVLSGSGRKVLDDVFLGTFYLFSL